VTYLAVCDEGIGIPEAAQSQLFRRFYRGANVDGRDIHGTGIGLFVAHAIITRHGGWITVESTEQRGSIFTVNLPDRARRTM
jgi:signal transduction histidine kinase